MPTTPTLSAYQTAIGNSYDSLVAANYSAASNYLDQAEVLLAGLPLDITTGDRGTKLREQLDGARKAITHAEQRASNNNSEFGLILGSFGRPA